MIVIKNLTKIFNQGKNNECKAINNLSLIINDGECLAITGKSGSGKSTLMHIMCGIEKATSGTVEIDGKEITKLSDADLAKYRASNIGVVMQDFCLINECSVLENVMLPLNFIKMKNIERIKKSAALINGVGLGDYMKKKVSELSGGEKQRVAIARALAANANYIYADEPTGALDSKTSKDIMDMLLRINKRNKTLIIITHNPIIAERCNKIIELSDGQIIKEILL